MKNFFQNRKTGFWLTICAACAALIGAIAYCIAYASVADPVTGTWDRVFKWTVFGLMIGGSVISIFGEALKWHFMPIAAAVLYGIGLAMHLVETAFPFADLLTGVRFYGGNVTLAILFSIVFAVAVLLHVIGSFFRHESGSN